MRLNQVKIENCTCRQAHNIGRKMLQMSVCVPSGNVKNRNIFCT